MIETFKKFFFIILFISPQISESQQVFYSQYYSSPLNLNPSMTGIGEFGRLGVNYRNQWTSIGDGDNS